MRRDILTSLIAASLMLGSALLAKAITPTQKLSDIHGELNLETAVPKQFGDWRLETQGNTGIVDPQRQQLLDRLYTQMLARTYVNSKGEHIMLSIAYGNDQRDGMQMHYPEVCYPAQGFELLSERKETLNLPNRNLPVKRLETKMGNQRYEPVTYWTVIGKHTTVGGTDKKLTELSYGLSGVIPDGLLFRISSITSNTRLGYQLHDQFAASLMKATNPSDLERLAGSPTVQ